ncbi:MAG: GAF domain-containing protein, partial [Leptospira sp.]|nr:GAF domain-containing protein [Leptospira sp.]
MQADIYSLDRLRDVCSANPDQIVQIIFYITAASLESRHQEIHETLKHHPSVISRFIVVAPLDYDPIGKTKIEKDLFYSTVPEGVPSFFLATTLINAFGYLQMIQEKFELQKKVNISSNEISKLTTIGISLSIEKDYTKLLRLILDSAREIALADSGSLYLVDKDETGKPVKLRFKISALHDIEEFSLDINKESIAGYVASTGEQLNIPDTYALTGKEEYKFNKKPDKDYNYYSKSMLVVPMKNHKDEVVGVIQLINKKKNFN